MKRARKTGGVPVLKLPPSRMDAVLLALRANEYDREGFKWAVLDLFAGAKEEKSVFRGMAIPTLRALGLLLGFEKELSFSSDGALAAAGAAAKDKGPMARLLTEIEKDLGLDAPWTRGAQPATKVAEMLSVLDGTDESPTGETKRRVARWLQYLEFYGAVRLKDGKYARVNFAKTGTLSAASFAEQLVAAYRSLSPKAVGEPTVSIDETARALMLSCFERDMVVTRRDFDRYLTRCLEARDVDVHLHRSMGAGQRLFHWRDGVYETLSIRRDANA